jgi:hypothetical protein
MSETMPVAQLLATTYMHYDAPTPWGEARQRLEHARETYWLASTSTGGAPHVRPILAVWADDALHFVSGSTTAKTALLAANPRVAVTVASELMDLVVEGEAVRVADETTLRHVADAYLAKYGWPVTVRDGAFFDTEGAPTAGPPPYEVYALVTHRAFGFPHDDTYSPTRWLFDAPPAPRSAAEH